MGVLTERPEITDTNAIEQAKQDKIDLNCEIAGIDNGRMKRFLNDGSITYHGETKKQKAEREFHTMLDMLLAQDPIYAALYHEVTEEVGKAKQAVELAMIDINQRLEASDRRLQFLRENAAELKDGTKVFKSSIDNSIYTEHGKRLTAEEAQNIAFTGTEPSLDEYQNTKASYDLAVSQKAEVETYQRDVLDPATKRINDKDEPPSMDELKELNKTIETKMPDIVKANGHNVSLAINASNEYSTSVAHDIEKTQLNVPDMAKSFDLARVDIPDLGEIPENAPVPTRTLN